MASRSQIKASPERIKMGEPSPDITALLKIILRLVSESDQSIVLVGCTALERVLELSLLEIFIPLEGPKKEKELNLLFKDGQFGPLVSFSSKIRIGYALGLLGRNQERTSTSLGKSGTLSPTDLKGPA